MPRSSKKGILAHDISFGRISLAQKALLAKHLAVMIRSGLTITDALETAEESASGTLANVLRASRESITAGHSISKAFAEHPKAFSDLFVQTVHAGEIAGTLSENFEHIADELSKEKQLADKIKSAMLYPVIVLSAAVVLGLVLSFVVLPKITPLFAGLGVELPITTRAIIWFADTVEKSGGLLFVGIIAVLVGGFWLVRRKFMQPITHFLLLKTPLIKRVTVNANLSRFARTLGTLIKSGVTIDEALEITAYASSNRYYRRALMRVEDDVRRGSSLSESLAAFPHLFPIITERMVRVGETSGKLEDTLLYLSGFYEERVDTATKGLATAVEPVLLLVIGLVVGFLALAIITPIYDITGNIRK